MQDKLNIIFNAFAGDSEINKYCDEEDKDKNLIELSESICNKIEEYEKVGDCVFEEILIDNKSAGYLFCWKNLLVSFCVNKKFRTAENLKQVFETIRNKFESDFICFMWKRNTRAINWLKKNGMYETETNIDNITILKLCQ